MAPQPHELLGSSGQFSACSDHKRSLLRSFTRNGWRDPRRILSPRLRLKKPKSALTETMPFPPKRSQRREGTEMARCGLTVKYSVLQRLTLTGGRPARDLCPGNQRPQTESSGAGKGGCGAKFFGTEKGIAPRWAGGWTKALEGPAATSGGS